MADSAIYDLTQESALNAADRVLLQQTSAATRATSATVALMGLLVPVAASVTTGDHTATVGQCDVLTISGLTAARSWVLPTAAQVGERCAVYCVTNAPATLASVLQIKTGAAGDLLDGVDHSSTIKTALLIAGESYVVECYDAAGPHWRTVYDGRIPCHSMMRLTTSATGEASATITYPTDKSGVWSSDHDVGALSDTSTEKFTTRRVGRYTLHATGAPTGGMAGTFNVYIYKNTTDYVVSASSYASSTAPAVTCQYQATVAAAATFRFRWMTSGGGGGLIGLASPRAYSSFSILEVL